MLWHQRATSRFGEIDDLINKNNRLYLSYFQETNLGASPEEPSDHLTPIVHMLKKDNDELRARVKELLNKTLKVHQLEMQHEKISNDYDQV